MATIVTGEQARQIWSKLGEIQRQVHQSGGYPFDFEQLLDALQGVIEGKFIFPQVGLTLKQRLLPLHLDGWNQDILKWKREDQPPTELGEGELLDLGRDISTPDAEAEIDRRGYEPANIEELCVYGAKHPDAQRQNPIIALGSVFVHRTDGSRYSPALDEGDAGRYLYLSDRDNDWHACCRFLAVRKGARKLEPPA